MISRYTHKGLTWIDLESPSNEEARSLIEEFNVDPLVAEELLSPTLRPKVDVFPNHIYLILHFPALKHTHQTNSDQEVDFIIGRNYIITVRYDTIDPLHKFSKVFEVNSILDRSDIGEHAGYVFFYMIKKLYRAVAYELDYMNDTLRTIEDHIFEGEEKEMVRDISNVSKSLLTFKQTLRSHSDILSSFEQAGELFFDQSFAYYLKAITGEYFKVNNEISSLIDTVVELRETNNSLLSTKQNEVMKVLTIMAFITFPLSLIASIFGMNTVYLPIVGGPNDFWIIISIMAIGTIFFFGFFKYKKWL